MNNARLQFCQDRWESPEDESIDDLADTINQAIEELTMCRDSLARVGWGEDRREIVAKTVRDIGGYLREVNA